jgi:hypothetical protein
LPWTPAFTNYALDRAGHQTLRIAIGDNLLTETLGCGPHAPETRVFVVQRSASGPAGAPGHIQAAVPGISVHSLQVDNVPVWIAQREGTRQGTGSIALSPAVIKMLSLSRDKQSEEFGAHIADLRIVPVSIAYELDPCDALKANELWQRRENGRYEKTEREDVTSIGLGIAGSKGRVHVHFGTPLGPGYETPLEVAGAIDAQIIGGYRLHPSNLLAWRLLHGERDLSGLEVAPGSCGDRAFRARIEAMPEGQRPLALAAYANAVEAKLSLNAAQ